MITTIITLIKNLWAIGLNLPSVIALVAPLIKMIGSDEFQKMIQTITEGVKNVWKEIRKESPETPEIPQTQTQRRRILDRFRQRTALAWLNITEDEFIALQNKKSGTEDPAYLDA